MYPHYDIVMWSQTHWRWLETKLVELGILGGDTSYKVGNLSTAADPSQICFVADRTTMFPVRPRDRRTPDPQIFSERSGQMIKHE